VVQVTVLFTRYLSINPVNVTNIPHLEHGNWQNVKILFNNLIRLNHSVILVEKRINEKKYM
jgi:hypothetical protein